MASRQGFSVSVSVAETADATLHAAVARLVPQLSRSSPAPTLAQLERIIAEPATTLFVATTDGTDGDGGEGVGSGENAGEVVGMLTLATFMLPTGVRAWIEDVVVDDDARGSGVASALVEAALDHAAHYGARTVDLTSRPDRLAANRLYVRIGFVRRETNVYRRTGEEAE